MKEEKEVIIPAVPSSNKRKFSYEKEAGALQGSADHEIALTPVAAEPAKTEESAVEEESKESWALQEKLLKTTCTLALVLWVIIMAALSIMTDSNIFNTFVGLSPFLMTIIVSFWLVDKYHMESGFLMVFPFIFTGIFLVLGFGGFLEVDYRVLSVVNLIAGLFFEAVLVMQHSFITKGHMKQVPMKKEEEKEEEHKAEEAAKADKAGQHFEILAEPVDEKREYVIMHEPARKLVIKLDDEGIKSFVSNIEDKAKAINAVIGRVYSVRRGGTESMRKVVRIDPEHYNEFNDLKDQKTEKRKKAALVLLKKIMSTLALLEKKEIDVFEKEDLTGLLKLNRDPHGSSMIIDVLSKNDSDPVKQYFESAKEFCENAIKELGPEDNPKKPAPKPIVLEIDEPSRLAVRKEQIKKKLKGKKIILKKA